MKLSQSHQVALRRLPLKCQVTAVPQGRTVARENSKMRAANLNTVRGEWPAACCRVAPLCECGMMEKDSRCASPPPPRAAAKT